jgi:hypothetical protein
LEDGENIGKIYMGYNDGYYGFKLCKNTLELLPGTKFRGAIEWDSVNESESGAYKTAQSASGTASSAWTKASNASDGLASLVDGGYTGGTFINGSKICTAEFEGGTFNGGTFNGGTFNGSEFYGVQFHGSEFNITSEETDSAFNLYGPYGGIMHNFLKIRYYEGDVPYVVISSPAGGYINFRNYKYFYDHTEFDDSTDFYGDITFKSASNTVFSGNVDFKNATVTGLTTVAVFG